MHIRIAEYPGENAGYRQVGSDVSVVDKVTGYSAHLLSRGLHKGRNQAGAPMSVTYGWLLPKDHYRQGSASGSK